MRRLLLLFAALCIALPSLAQVVRLKLDDTIQPVSEEYISRGIDYAAEHNAQAVLIELHTPGGLVTSTRAIISKILGSKVPVIIYVYPTGANAASAGFFILESADIAAMAPGTNTGSAHPVSLAFGVAQTKEDDTMKAKIENDLAAFLRSYVSKRGRNVALAETGVRESKAFSDQEALSQNLIDVIAKDEQDLLSQVNGRTVKRFDGSTVVMKIAAAPITDYDRSLKERLLGFLVDPNIAFLIFAIGAIGLYAEFNHPGAIIPGVVGTVCILLALFAFHFLPIRYAAVTLILASFIFFALEAKFATHGILGIAGIACLALGGMLLVDGPIPEMRVKWEMALSVSVAFGLITVFLMTIALRARRNKVTTGIQGLLGQTGVARSPLSPTGKVTVMGEIWDAASLVPVAAGEPVVIRGIDGLTLRVEPVAQSVAAREVVLQR
ncbi:Nodulation efficiency protein NfeD [Candidatus Koribacter versatilis Ellin345]|uniref:Nodulation efficiency protein NfeD n=1 Tax=Koribacter versatilis (strain Ellin345) TaxID=204669 RepID=Q1INM0_KORVE|nr:nodulation protein NfeD [Candidatus Koribacter versatilis]ABF41530.1 Nodulation efficiency protein NfeD [Candidatus Koribacter versatilis Ellin345]